VANLHALNLLMEKKSVKNISVFDKGAKIARGVTFVAFDLKPVILD
jgi:hypothetical protein